MRRLLPLLLCLCSVGGVSAQERSLFDSLQYRAEMQGTLAGGDHSPLWLNANKYGLSSLKKANGYIRGAIMRPLSNDDGRRWGVGYGVDLALAAGFTSTLVIQQAYIEARWLKGVLTVGAKEPRPVPQVRIALPDYWSIPGTRNWLALKGHIAYGMTTDDRWQKDFKAPNTRYTENTLYHSKAGYLRIGPKNITFEFGLEMASQFGGKSHMYENGVEKVYDNSSNLKAFWNALIPGGSDATDGNFKNVEGNQLGSWVMRLNFDQPTWNIGVYADQFFEDHSMMTHFSKSGDGYFRYDFKDWLLGVELKLKQTRWLEGVVVEYLYSKYQGGPVYHDHTANVDIQISGRDNYYNHHLFTGWQHWGQVMGNPLYRSPLYNDDRKIEVEHNRFKAWHLGFNGSPIDGLHYRVLATWQRSFGSYYYLPPTPVENVSLLAEASYALRHGWLVKGAFAMDNGKLRGESYGVQLSVIKTGIIGKKK